MHLRPALAKDDKSQSVNFDGLQKLVGSEEKANSGTRYIICNEQSQHETLTDLKNDTALRQTLADSKSPAVHVGFSIWFNLDLLAELSLQYALIFDIDNNMIALYRCIEKNLKDVEIDTPQKFIQSLVKELVEKNIAFYPKEYLEEELNKNLTKGFGFLSSREAFLKIKKMVNEKRIFFGQADITNENMMQTILGWCKHFGVNVATLYISNIAEWIFQNRSSSIQDQLVNNVKLLSQPNTRIIHALYPTNEKKGSGPPQQVCLKDKLSKETFMIKKIVRPTKTAMRSSLWATTASRSRLTKDNKECEGSMTLSFD